MKTKNAKISCLLLIMMLHAMMLHANGTNAISDDTIPSRYRNYYYTHWYDECPAYQNGGWIDSCWYTQYKPYFHSGNHLKREHTDQPLKIKGLVAMISMTPQFTYENPEPGEQYLYIMKRVDMEDTVRPNSPSHFYRMRILDSVRFDTVIPRYMEMTQGSSDIPKDYCYVYEAYFDKPIVVDSEFYLYGSHNEERVYDENTGRYTHLMYRPLSYVRVESELKSKDPVSCPPESFPDDIIYVDTCPSDGRWTTMSYIGYADFSIYGYPVTGQPWAMNEYVIENDPHGFYLAIVENYKLEVNTVDSTMGIGVGSGIYYNSEGTEIQAVPMAGCRFSHWNDGSTENPRVIYLTQDTSFTAYFDTGVYYTVTTAVNEAYWGTVEGGGQYAANTEVELRALPSGGFMFERWDDGDTENPRTVTLTQDTLFTAVFAQDTTQAGIAAAEALSFAVSPNPTGGELTVSTGSETPSQAEVYDASGRCVLRAELQGPKDVLDVRQLPTGRYLLRLSNGDRTGSRAFVKK